MTTDCDDNFDCIRNSNHVYCKVENCVDNKVHFIKCLNENYCPYRMLFGHSYICNCPTRKEIYNKFGI